MPLFEELYWQFTTYLRFYGGDFLENGAHVSGDDNKDRFKINKSNELPLFHTCITTIQNDIRFDVALTIDISVSHSLSALPT